MSDRAITYVRSLQITDPVIVQVFLLLADRTRPSSPFADEDSPMGLELRDTDIPALAARIGIATDDFRERLRIMRKAIPMDVLEHKDGVWEIVYGPGYTSPKPKRRIITDATVEGIEALALPGWERYSTWGRDGGLGCLYAQLYLNGDNRDAPPRIWITPPRYSPQTIDELAQIIATVVVPYMPIKLPPSIVRDYMTGKLGGSS